MKTVHCTKCREANEVPEPAADYTKYICKKCKREEVYMREMSDYIFARCEAMRELGIEINHPDAGVYIVQLKSAKFASRVKALEYAEGLAAKL